MPEPEIARRCPTCGASIRDLAFFCPQCGKALPRRDKPTSQETQPAGGDQTSPKDTASLDEIESRQISMSDTLTIERPDNAPRSAAPPPSMADTLAIQRPLEPRKVVESTRARGAVGAKIQRASDIARGVEGDVIHRVQKVREISSVVLDEAGDDPSLRFVLVAAIVFVLFLVIVLLNKLIT